MKKFNAFYNEKMKIYSEANQPLTTTGYSTTNPTVPTATTSPATTPAPTTTTPQKPPVQTQPPMDINKLAQDFLKLSANPNEFKKFQDIVMKQQKPTQPQTPLQTGQKVV